MARRRLFAAGVFAVLALLVLCVCVVPGSSDERAQMALAGILGLGLVGSLAVALVGLVRRRANGNAQGPCAADLYGSREGERASMDGASAIVRTLKWTLIATFGVPFVLVALLFGGRMILASQDFTLDGAERAAWLPVGASDICCRGTGIARTFEFSITEDGFRAWAARIDVPLAEIEGKHDVPRYLQDDIDPSDNSDEAMELWGRARAVMSDGLRGERRRSNGGGWTIAFDRKASRAYGQWANH